MGWTIFIALVVVIAAFVFVKSRRKKRKCIQGHLKHVDDYVKYHPNTDIKIKRHLNEDNKEDNVQSNEKAVAVLKFDGDIKASERNGFSRIVDEIILNKERFNEVVVLVESPGGSVAEYGYLFAEMQRLRNQEQHFQLTACVDTVAASGGYLMSLPAKKILASPFAMVGSIGVVSFIPNVRKLLEKFNIEPRTFTAGSYKRTVSLTDNATPEQVQKYQEQLNLIHDQFQHALTQYRPHVDLTKVATGEAWLAQSTVNLDLKLVDAIQISSDYLLELNQKFDLVEFVDKEKKKPLAKLMEWLDSSISFFKKLELGL